MRRISCRLSFIAPCLLLSAVWMQATTLFPSPPAGLRVTQFATGLNFPTTMAVLPDGSLLAGTTPSSGLGGYEAYYLGSGQLIRMTDLDHNGVADGAGTVVAGNLPGAVTSVRQMGSLIAVATTGNGTQSGLGDADITFLQPGLNPDSPYSVAGSVHIHFPQFDAAINVAMDAMPTAGTPGSYDLFFSLGAGNTLGASVGNVALTGLVSTAQPAGSVVRMRIDTNNPTPVITGVQTVATGLRNSGGILINQTSGDVYFSDNGYEDQFGATVSADEVNLLTAAQIASNSAVAFGYPGSYTDYATGAFVGGTGVPPVAAFRPLGGAESIGLNELAFMPSGFPAGLNSGIAGGFDGAFNFAGPANQTNPVVLLDPTTGNYIHFIAGGQTGVGHLIGLASTSSSLFLADMASVDGWNGGTGVIYQLSLDPTPEPASLGLFLISLAALLGFRRSLRTRDSG